MVFREALADVEINGKLLNIFFFIRNYNNLFLIILGYYSFYFI